MYYYYDFVFDKTLKADDNSHPVCLIKKATDTSKSLNSGFQYFNIFNIFLIRYTQATSKQISEKYDFDIVPESCIIPRIIFHIDITKHKVF